MKKIIILFAILLMSFSVISCGMQEEKTDEEKIIDRIEALESAINNDDYNAFLDCLHTDTSFFVPLLESMFHDLFSATTYVFHDAVISFTSDSTAHVDCLANIDSVLNVDTDFIMQTEGDDWYVNEWYEETEEIFNRFTVTP